MSDVTGLEIATPSRNRFVVSGEIDAHTAAVLRQSLIAADPELGVVLDLTAVEFIDSSGLRVIVEQHERCQARGSTLVLHEPSRVVRRLLEVTALDRVLHIV